MHASEGDRVSADGRVIEATDADLTARVRGRLAPVFAGVAAVLIVAAVMAGSLGLPSRSSSPVIPRAWIRGAVPLTPPPPGVPVAYVPDPGDTSRIIAFDWTGRAVGSLRPAQAVRGQEPFFVTSRDGSHLVVDAPDGRVQWVISAQGQRLASLPLPPERTDRRIISYPVMFADDERTICQERYAMTAGDTAPRSLYVVAPGGAERLVTHEAPSGGPPDVRWGLAACSVRNDTAVIVGYHSEPPEGDAPPPQTATTQSGSLRGVSVSGGITVHPPWVVMVRTVRLSTGRETYRHAYEPHAVYSVTASPDTTTLIEERTSGAPALVRDTATDTVVEAPLRGFAALTGPAFGHLLVFSASSKSGSTDFTVLDWRTGRLIWHHAVDGLLSSVTQQADGDGVVLITRPGWPPCPATDDYMMLDGQGTPVRLTARPSSVCPQTAGS